MLSSLASLDSLDSLRLMSLDPIRSKLFKLMLPTECFIVNKPILESRSCHRSDGLDHIFAVQSSTQWSSLGRYPVTGYRYQQLTVQPSLAAEFSLHHPLATVVTPKVFWKHRWIDGIEAHLQALLRR